MLAQQYNTYWCPEYAREYLLQRGKDYSFDNLLCIAKGQLASEKETIAKAENEGKEFIFIDTDMYVMKVWCEFVFSKCHLFILEEAAIAKYDLYLLCNTDLPWASDTLREYPDAETRNILYRIYKDLLLNQQTPWIEISGNYAQRVKSAIDAVNSLTQD